MVAIIARFLPKLLPLLGSKYVYAVLFAVGVGVGGWGVAEFYQGKIAKMEISYTQSILDHTQRVITKDKEYRDQLEFVNNKLLIVKGNLDEELAKKDYICAVPDAGIRLFNDALRSGASRQPSQ